MIGNITIIAGLLGQLSFSSMGEVEDVDML